MHALYLARQSVLISYTRWYYSSLGVSCFRSRSRGRIFPYLTSISLMPVGIVFSRILCPQCGQPKYRWLSNDTCRWQRVHLYALPPEGQGGTAIFPLLFVLLGGGIGWLWTSSWQGRHSVVKLDNEWLPPSEIGVSWWTCSIRCLAVAPHFVHSWSSLSRTRTRSLFQLSG
jgi:hypothetical protein